MGFCETSNFSIFTFSCAGDLKFCTRSYSNRFVFVFFVRRSLLMKEMDRKRSLQKKVGFLVIYLFSFVYLLMFVGCSGGRVVSTSASHQCGPGSIPGWGSDPGAVSEKGLSSPV